MSLAIFDLDHTLLSDDSDYLWGKFLAQQGIVDGAVYERENQKYFDDYKAGTLDIFAFLSFSLKPLTQLSAENLTNLHAKFMQQCIIPVIAAGTPALIQHHRDHGDTLLIITATNRFITAPIAQYLGIPNLLASEPEMIDGRYTGRITGTPCYQHGKVTRLNEWLANNEESLLGSSFYSDSRNDIPLLEMVDHPYAVDPDETLRATAKANRWPIISLRTGYDPQQQQT